MLGKTGRKKARNGELWLDIPLSGVSTRRAKKKDTHKVFSMRAVCSNQRNDRYPSHPTPPTHDPHSCSPRPTSCPQLISLSVHLQCNSMRAANIPTIIQLVPRQTRPPSRARRQHELRHITLGTNERLVVHRHAPIARHHKRSNILVDLGVRVPRIFVLVDCRREARGGDFERGRAGEGPGSVLGWVEVEVEVEAADVGWHVGAHVKGYLCVDAVADEAAILGAEVFGGAAGVEGDDEVGIVRELEGGEGGEGEEEGDEIEAAHCDDA
jgi:hypothetical protein